MKWYWWALIAIVLIVVIYKVATSMNSGKNASQIAADLQNKVAQGFDPYKITPIAA